jgi:demethylmenaquinone methyltransferase/2-methoxy-6-polyprenyl-1,4-benzoquinol methylase
MSTQTTNSQEDTTTNGPETRRLGSGAMFDGIAARYDLLNRIISLGIDKSWRRKAIDALAVDALAVDAPEPSANLGATRSTREVPHVLDVATGTADIALGVAARYPAARVTGVDPSERMLEVGRTKVAEAGLEDRIALQVGDAQDLAFPNETFDGAIISFGIRNVPDRALGLREMTRVLRPGARVVVLELSEPKGGLMGSMARIHVHHIVPFLGGLLSGQREYAYLQRSIAAFPPAEDFAELMATCGLEMESVLPLTFGTAHLYVGKKRGPAAT